MDKLLDKLSSACSQASSDMRLRQIMNDLVLTPLQAEISSGKLDECIALALIRVTLPLIILVLVLIVVSIIQINTSMKLMHPQMQLS